MKTIKKVTVIPIFLEQIPEVADMIQDRIYISEKYQVANHLCLCGCGNETVTPLGVNGWGLGDSDGKISMAPSILQRFECQSHYIIANNVANFV